jgi:hypothetical protein
MKQNLCSRRQFLRVSVAAAATASFGANIPRRVWGESSSAGMKVTGAKVAIVPCRGYGSEVAKAYEAAFDYLGGIGTLVKGKTVTVKLNLTGSNFSDF